MKRLILLALTITTLMTTSCSKDEIDDFTKPENISGTTWKSASDSNWSDEIEYALLIFTSTTSVEGWTKPIDDGEIKDWTGTFSISNERISISYEGETLTGIIEGDKLNTIIDGKSYVFLKQ